MQAKMNWLPDYHVLLTVPKVCALLAFGVVLGLAQSAKHTKAVVGSEYPTPTIREEQKVIVDGVSETWRLQWTTVPKPYCEPSEESLTCPCMGFAYGESGDLFLVRIRSGTEIDRLHLTPFFTEQSDTAVVQRWPTDDKEDFKESERDDFPNFVSKRGTVQVMHFADYDHDGRASEFYIQTEALPCGKSFGVVIGLSNSNPRLHVFGTASNPNKSLYLQKREWEALRDASGPVEVLDWACRDHVAETETRLVLHWTREGVAGTRREYTCSSSGKAGRLIQEEPL